MSVSKPTKYLLDWFVRYIKNRDLLFRKISNVHQEEDRVVIEQKDGKKIVYVVEAFPEDFLEIIKDVKEENKGVVVYNSKENFDNLIKNWKELSKIRGLIIYFTNPFSKLEKKWIINPGVHASISDESVLEQGLSSMYLMVDSITRKEVEKITS